MADAHLLNISLDVRQALCLGTQHHCWCNSQGEMILHTTSPHNMPSTPAHLILAQESLEWWMAWQDACMVHTCRQGIQQVYPNCLNACHGNSAEMRLKRLTLPCCPAQSPATGSTHHACGMLWQALQAQECFTLKVTATVGRDECMPARTPCRLMVESHGGMRKMSSTASAMSLDVRA